MPAISSRQINPLASAWGFCRSEVKSPKDKRFTAFPGALPTGVSRYGHALRGGGAEKLVRPAARNILITGGHDQAVSIKKITGLVEANNTRPHVSFKLSCARKDHHRYV